MAVNKPIELTVDGLPKAIYLEPVTLANTTTGTKSDPVELNIGQVGQTGGFFGFGASKTVSGAGVLTYTFDAATVEKLFGESGDMWQSMFNHFLLTQLNCKTLRFPTMMGKFLRPRIRGGTGGGDNPNETNTAKPFPVTYKYLDENGTEIPNSAQTVDVPADGTIDFSPLKPPAGYTFDPTLTKVDVGSSAVADSLQSIISGAKDFDSLNSSLATLAHPSQFIDYGSNELTITYQGKKIDTTHMVSFKLVDQDGNPVKNTNNVSTFQVAKYPYSTGTTITTSGLNFNVPGYTMRLMMRLRSIL